MLWTLALKGRLKTSVLKPDMPVKISNVALVPSGATSSLEHSITKQVKVFIKQSGHEYLLCTLDSDNPSEMVDMMFDYEDEVAFRVDGDGTVHFIGSIEPGERASEPSSSSASSYSSYDSIDEMAADNQERKIRRAAGCRQSRLAQFRAQRRS